MKLWSDDPTWTSGPRQTSNTKTAMTEAEILQGLVGGVSLPGDKFNWFMNRLMGFRHRAYFGDGSDGDATISTTVTLTQNKFYDTLTIASGGLLQPDGYIVRALTEIIVQVGGAIRGDGAAGGANSGSTGGTAGAAHANELLGGAGAGAAGGNGGVNGSAASNVSNSWGGWGALGGAGGSSATTGGAGGIANLPTAGAGANPQQVEAAIPAVLTGHQLIGGSVVLILGGAGGGGGGGGASDGGGGGGAGARPLILAAPKITIAGAVTADGGAGGTGGADAGGGAGGGGGAVILVAGTISTSGTLSAAGGLGGSGGANPGGNGTAGTVLQIAP